MTAGNDIVNGSANAFTVAGRRTSRSTIARLVGSASAWNTRPSPSDTDWLGMYLTIASDHWKVK
jgi:hypothetical protein